MNPESGAEVAVAGAGICGSVLATALAARGHRVTVFEARPDPAAGPPGGDRSINLAISTRGLAALELVGLADTVRREAIPMRGRRIHHVDGRLGFQPYSSDPSRHLLSVSRRRLNEIVLDGARRAGVEIRFDTAIVDVDPATGEVTTAHDGRRSLERFDVVFGADGARSAVREALVRHRGVRVSIEPLDHGYKELSVPPNPDGTHALEAEALHIWPRGRHMMIALPNTDGSFTGTLFWPLGERAAVTTARDVAAFRTEFADAVPLMGELETELLEHPVGSLATVRVSPWTSDGRVLLVGDAAHAVVPFYGQGANAALEDVVEVMGLLDRGLDWAAAMEAFASTRPAHADALADLALDNYREMRDRVASPWFLARQALERRLHRWFPERFVPLYTMVTFTRTPYRDAVDRARRQTRVLDGALIAAVLVAGGLVLAATRRALRWAA